MFDVKNVWFKVIKKKNNKKKKEIWELGTADETFTVYCKIVYI